MKLRQLHLYPSQRRHDHRFRFVANCQVITISEQVEPFYRRLILLIFVDWLPPDRITSRSCLTLGPGISALQPRPKRLPRVLLTGAAPRPMTKGTLVDITTCYAILTSLVMAQMYPKSSRAMAVTVCCLHLPEAIRRR